jgi:hypothetical protein
MAIIDPRDFGRLEAEVNVLSAQVAAQGQKIDQLLELANKSKGGFWAGMAMVSFISSAVGFFFDHWLKR